MADFLARDNDVAMPSAARYSAERLFVENVPVIRLTDHAARTEVSILPGFGNNAYSMLVEGEPVLWAAQPSLTAWMANPVQAGNPLLVPWCNRIDGDSYFANSRQYLLNPNLRNFRRDAFGNPLHGVLVYAGAWEVGRLEAGAQGAMVTSRLEFWRNSAWMAQFPFAHNLEITYRLSEGVLEVETAVENLAIEPMPLSLGYHTYYQLTDSVRDDWRIRIPAREHVVLSDCLIPTGELEPNPYIGLLALRGMQLDDVFTNLERGDGDRAVFQLEGKRQRLSVEFGPKFPVSVIYAPSDRPFVCFEPMTGVTDVFNLAHTGKFPLQSIAPGETWRESFLIRPENFDQRRG